MPRITSIGVIGAGAWGTALACHTTDNKTLTYLWAHEEQTTRNIRKFRENREFLPGISIPESVRVSSKLEELSKECPVLIMATPAQKTREVLRRMKPFLNTRHRFVIASKGIETSSGKLLSKIFQQELGKSTCLGVLSGPTFAIETARKLPTAAVLACHHEEFAIQLQKILHKPWFRLYRSTDMIGVQVAGAVKNVLAIASGISEGMQLGLNARAALVCRGLTEMTRLGVKMGGMPETFAGLSGLGDLVLTATDSLSRNHALGVKLGQGASPETCLKEQLTVTEGVATSISIHQLRTQNQLEMPICEAVYKVLHAQLSCKDALRQLLERVPTESESTKFLPNQPGANGRNRPA